jgi:hypothetical protein
MEREISPFYYFSLAVRRGAWDKEKGKRAKFINKTRKSCFFYFLYSHSAVEKASLLSRPDQPTHTHSTLGAENGENRFGEIFLLPMSSYYIMAVLLAPGGWIKREKKKRRRPPPPRALFSHKKQFNLSCREGNTTQKTASRRK